MMTSLPNLLTLSRILAIPALVASFYLREPVSNWVAMVIFVAAAVTDYFDGYLARSRGLVSNLGRFLDPVADKLLVAAALMMLVARDRVDSWTTIPAVIILCREIIISGLREFLAELRVIVRVSTLAKWKTGIQMGAIGTCLVGDAGEILVPGNRVIGEGLLWIAALLTLYTGYDYLRAGLRHMMVEPPKPEAAPSGAAPVGEGAQR
ncbi:MAG: CDP-diacylglycerol--glycerol-3-phosphate 3-phosphatidyltransferase [Alphaproteobacteria bacterium]|nr:CDP-diacylglycerol--glycerol-3-phosphate 3-phosphatidyltransferase [Alphaproteobacteria bacterium]